MPTSLATLVARTRRFIRDYPSEDVLTASVSAAGTTLTVADGTLYYKDWPVEIEQETMLVTANGSGTSVVVKRGAKGSTAATHVVSSTVLLRPHYTYLEILDALNAAAKDAYPYIYKAVVDESLTTAVDTYEYMIPSTIRHLSRVELKFSGEPDYREMRKYRIKRGATPKLQFDNEPDVGATVRLYGFGPFDDLATGGSLDAQWPANADSWLPIGAAAYLLASGEAGRVRETRPNDDRENANRTGSSMGASNALYQRYLRAVNQHAMPPLPPHVRPVF